jgi:cytoskeletal protein RodZ
MEAMTAVSILGVIAVAGAIVAWTTWRRAFDERHSVQHHQHALETLRHVADRREQIAVSASQLQSATPQIRMQEVASAPPRRSAHPTVQRTRANGANRNGATRVEAGGSATHGPNGKGRARGVHEKAPSRNGTAGNGTKRNGTKGNGTRNVASRSKTGAGSTDDTRERRPKPSPNGGGTRPEPAVMVFVDDSVELAGSSSVPEHAAEDQAGRQWTHHRARVPRTLRWVRRHWPLVGAVVVVAVAIGIAFAVSPSGQTRGAPTRSHTRSVARRHGVDNSRSEVASANTGTTSSTSLAVAPIGTTVSQATYTAPAGPYTLHLDATGLCWVMATEAPGEVLWTGTMNGGQSRTLTATGNVDLRLGAASDIDVILDGKPVQLPSGFRSPFDMVFRPAA